MAMFNSYVSLPEGTLSNLPHFFLDPSPALLVPPPRRSSYRATKSDYYTHAHDLPPQLGGCQSESGVGPQGRRAVRATGPLGHSFGTAAVVFLGDP